MRNNGRENKLLDMQHFGFMDSYPDPQKYPDPRRKI